MGFGGVTSSDSTSKVRVSNSQSATSGDDSPITRINVGKHGNLEIANTTSNTYVDPGAFTLVGKLIDAQSGITLGSLDFAAAAQEQNAKLAETKVTDGANLNQKTTLVALAVLGALALAFLMIRRH